MRTYRRAAAAALALTTLLAAMPAGDIRAEEEKTASKPLQATLEILKPFTYSGDPLLVRLAVFNTGDTPYDNSKGINLVGGLKVTGISRGVIPLKGKALEVDAKQQPAQIAPGGFFGVIQDVAAVAPDLSTADTYNISWSGAGIDAPPVTVRVIPKYDPKASYVAVMETDFGYLEFALLGDKAPKHVQNFYDLAMQGFYDGTYLHEVIKGVEVRGGDPLGTGNGWPGYALQPEITPGLEHVRGTLSSVKLGGEGQDNGSQFVITLGPAKKYDGSLTIFGQLTKGEETLKAIENIPTSGQANPPYFRPIKPVVIRSVTIKQAAS